GPQAGAAPRRVAAPPPRPGRHRQARRRGARLRPRAAAAAPRRRLAVKVVILSSHRPNIWKPRLIEDAAALGWDVTRLPGTTRDWPMARACQDAARLLWLFTRGRRPGGAALAMLQRVQDAGTRTAGVHLDLYWGLRRREHRIGASPWWSCQ